MAEGLVGRTQMPGFNILGLLLGGRGYAQDYFAKKDALALEQAQRQERGDFATNLLKSPEYRAAVPEADRQAQYGLWARQSYGPDEIAATGNSILVNRLSAYDQRAQAEMDQKLRLIAQQQQADLQKGNYDYAHRLQLSETKYATDERIRAEETIATNAAEAKRKQQEAILGGLQGQTQRNMAYDMMTDTVPGMPKRPADRDVVEWKGQVRLVPSIDSKEHNEMMKDLEGIQSLGGAVDEISDLMDMKKISGPMVGRVQSLITQAQLALKENKNLGSLDSSALEVMQNMISSYGKTGGYGADPRNYSIAREKLRVLQEGVKRSTEAWGDRWGTDPAAQPNRFYKSKLADIPPAPSGPAVIPSQIERTPQTRAGGRRGTEGAGGTPALEYKQPKPFRTRGGQ